MGPQRGDTGIHGTTWDGGRGMSGEGTFAGSRRWTRPVPSVHRKRAMLLYGAGCQKRTNHLAAPHNPDRTERPKKKIHPIIGFIIAPAGKTGQQPGSNQKGVMFLETSACRQHLPYEVVGLVTCGAARMG